MFINVTAYRDMAFNTSDNRWELSRMKTLANLTYLPPHLLSINIPPSPPQLCEFSCFSTSHLTPLFIHTLLSLHFLTSLYLPPPNTYVGIVCIVSFSHPSESGLPILLLLSPTFHQNLYTLDFELFYLLPVFVIYTSPSLSSSL